MNDPSESYNLPKQWTVRELAEAINLPRSTTLRRLRKMLELRVAEEIIKGKRGHGGTAYYRFSPGFSIR